MRILVFGAGAVGSLLGAFLARRHEVHLVARPAHVEAIHRSGLRVEGVESMRPRLEAHAAVPEGPFDLVLVTVKAFDTTAAIRDVRAAVGAGTVLATAQNGLGNWEALRAAFPHNVALAAPVTLGAVLEAPGAIRYNGAGRMLVGSIRTDLATAIAWAEEFTRCGLPATATDRPEGALWLKAIVNACINPLTAIHRVPNGRLLEDPALRARMDRACHEAAAVARAEGVPLPTDPCREAERVARDNAANRSSMLQSVERGRPTEIDAINGAILAAARRHGIRCPENQALYDEVRRLTP